MKYLCENRQDKRHHHKYIETSERLDTLQAAILNVKLKYYNETLLLRKKFALIHNEALKDYFKIPFINNNCTSYYPQHYIVVKKPDAVQEKFKKLVIPTALHYPLALHLQEYFFYWDSKKGNFLVSEKISSAILNLQINSYVTNDEIKYISEILIALKI